VREHLLGLPGITTKETFLSNLNMKFNDLLRDHWNHTFEKASLENLYSAFKNNPIQKVNTIKSKLLEKSYWII